MVQPFPSCCCCCLPSPAALWCSLLFAVLCCVVLYRLALLCTAVEVQSDSHTIQHNDARSMCALQHVTLRLEGKQSGGVMSHLVQDWQSLATCDIDLSLFSKHDAEHTVNLPLKFSPMEGHPPEVPYTMSVQVRAYAKVGVLTACVPLAGSLLFDPFECDCGRCPRSFTFFCTLVCLRRLGYEDMIAYRSLGRTRSYPRAAAARLQQVVRIRPSGISRYLLTAAANLE